ncbi:unnamed protein product [Didymodactylos carnosus]|uniref:Uncharacterized protein n=1 Tax=Didymodactylos carnosus TaxID=1234261 RepID=A0A8S2F091_9BILA|nr:unnamed protein product [Didymodactylos carnosus]CAF4091903.1 unnamed protein product [Didymodactylos carnosus]
MKMTPAFVRADSIVILAFSRQPTLWSKVKWRTTNLPHTSAAIAICRISLTLGNLPNGCGNRILPHDLILHPTNGVPRSAYSDVETAIIEEAY